jgi:hypothetical protein
LKTACALWVHKSTCSAQALFVFLSGKAQFEMPVSSPILLLKKGAEYGTIYAQRRTELTAGERSNHHT